MAVVHVVIVHLRGADMLAACLESLLCSEEVDLQVVVVFNGCNEGPPAIADDAGDVHIIATERSLGFSEANNFGVKWARAHLGAADFYYFLNDDTLSDPKALATLVSTLEADPQAACAGPLLLIQWAPDHINSLGINVTRDAWGWDEGIGIHRDDFGPILPRHGVIAVTGSALLIDSGVHLAVGGWTELYDYYFEDVDLCLKVRELGLEVVVEPEAVVKHQISATMAIDSDDKLFLFWRNRLVLAFVHWPFWLLLKVLWKACVDEILRTNRAENGLQRRALGGALRKLPAAVRARCCFRCRHDWARMLRPVGSVPVISLPQREGPPAVSTRVAESIQDGRSGKPPEFTGTWKSAQLLADPGTEDKRVLVVGAAPLPFENARMNFAPGARSWQFAKSLAEDGHTVCLAALKIPGGYDPTEGPVEESHRDGVLIYRFGGEAFNQSGVLDGLVDEFRPDAIVGASAVPSLRASELASGQQLWIDLFGDPMSEAQARAIGFNEGDQLTAYRDLLVNVLERGDAFSAVSDRQRYAVVGQLGLVGRLNRETAGREIVHTIPCCVLDSDDRPKAVEQTTSVATDEGRFVVLWSGGFNTWCDVETLVDGLDSAMESDPRILFVSTGGHVEGHDDTTYSRFSERVAESPHADHFLILGAVDAVEAAKWTARADLGVITEKPIYERILGSSGRLTNWLEVGLPFVCAATSEIGSVVESESLGFSYAPGDAGDFARAILEAAGDPERLRETAVRAQKFARLCWGRRVTTEPLRRWVRNGGRLPDVRAENPLSMTRLINKKSGNEDLIVELRNAASELERRYHEVRRELGDIHQSRMWRVWMFYLGARSLPRRLIRGRHAVSKGDENQGGDVR